VNQDPRGCHVPADRRKRTGGSFIPPSQPLLQQLPDFFDAQPLRFGLPPNDGDDLIDHIECRRVVCPAVV